MWALSRGDVVAKPRDDIQRREVMSAIIWNPGDCYVIDRLPNRSKMNSAYFVTKLPILIEQATFPRGKALHEK
jgi:hypothetical protein